MLGAHYPPPTREVSPDQNKALQIIWMEVPMLQVCPDGEVAVTPASEKKEVARSCSIERSYSH
jgi:hypothetical protein